MKVIEKMQLTNYINSKLDWYNTLKVFITKKQDLKNIYKNIRSDESHNICKIQATQFRRSEIHFFFVCLLVYYKQNNNLNYYQQILKII
ncbi:hypothetical protein TTHERM_000633273 (macronuclear) [Tetrahymena thermophila SB210]|uniref:Uncharacterized protein n=1 Tax=Tetrahymena thermophila (strain SB210) TaxID=312017 RepID=W7XJS3_TETTS|nr:hypothetical protein TTHERM_000633273 [Tetrahymena thermophila SB210]EWS75896.1 hypothetical protein TTHERM_000633273 [Tetrahymena thermophila SB210]|eukprot:XP_012651567.1 hypothetical protein TTHERM_000633273 [Tetrahymena thermophila SB210]